MTNPDFDTALAAFLAHAQGLVNEFYGANPHVLEIRKGRRYAKIVCRQESDPPDFGSAWAFIDTKNGDVLKAAGWSKPAKHARGTIFTDDPKHYGVAATGPHYIVR